MWMKASRFCICRASSRSRCVPIAFSCRACLKRARERHKTHFTRKNISKLSTIQTSNNQKASKGRGHSRVRSFNEMKGLKQLSEWCCIHSFGHRMFLKYFYSIWRIRGNISLASLHLTYLLSLLETNISSTHDHWGTMVPTVPIQLSP